MKLVLIPQDKLWELSTLWLPFIEQMAKRQRCYVSQRVDDLANGQITLVLIIDDERVVRAAIGLSFIQRGPDKIARIVWISGKDRHQWMGLYPELEQMCRDLGCKGMEAMARRGWARDLEHWGYRQTHLQYEKDF